MRIRSDYSHIVCGLWKLIFSLRAPRINLRDMENWGVYAINNENCHGYEHVIGTVCKACVSLYTL